MRDDEMAVFVTDEKSILRARAIIRVMMAVVPLAVGLLVLMLSSGSDRWIAAFVLMGGGVLVTLSVFYRGVIGVRVYEDRLAIITSSGETIARWNQVRLLSFLRMWTIDIYIGGLWPYSVPRNGADWEHAMGLIRDRVASGR